MLLDDHWEYLLPTLKLPLSDYENFGRLRQKNQITWRVQKIVTIKKIYL